MKQAYDSGFTLVTAEPNPGYFCCNIHLTVLGWPPLPFPRVDYIWLTTQFEGMDSWTEHLVCDINILNTGGQTGQRLQPEAEGAAAQASRPALCLRCWLTP